MANSEDPDEMPQQSLLCLLRTKSIFIDRIHSFFGNYNGAYCTL